MLVCQRAVYFFRLCITLCLWSTEASKILLVFPYESASQCVFRTPYLRALVKRGHELTVIHAYPQCDAVQGIHYIHIQDTHKAIDAVNFSVDSFISTNINWSTYYSSRDYVIKVSLNTFPNQEVKELMHSNAIFDLMVMEPHLTNALFGLAAHFKAQVIGLATCGSDWSIDELVGYTANSIFDPIYPMGFKRSLTFLDQLYNWAYISQEWLVMNLIYWPQMRQVFKQHLPHVNQSFTEIHNSFSLILLNQHFSVCRARPNVPGLVDIAGFHIPQHTPQLPKDLAEFIEQAKHGVIYFSLGWEVQSKDLPAKTIDMLLEIFASLPQRIIWKYEEKTLSKLSSNVYISPWLPQQAILAHPKVELFVTNGGLISVIEAVYYATPVLGLPMHFDQFRNLDCLMENGLGATLDWNTLTKTSLIEAFEKLLREPSYRQNALELSSRFRDRPMHPLDTAVYWTEYVLRYKGASHMRIHPTNIKFIDYYGIDKIFMVVSRLAINVSVVVFVLCKLKGFLRKGYLARKQPMLK